jgi:hypothetical protein
MYECPITVGAVLVCCPVLWNIRLIESADQLGQLPIHTVIKFFNDAFRRHRYSGYFDFIALFVGMNMPVYAINLNIVSLFVDYPFRFEQY